MRILLIAVLTIAINIGCKSSKDSTTVDAPKTADTRSADRGAKGGERGGPPSVDEVFKMDKDMDGKLSKMEVDDKLAKHFDKIDTNGDGFITKEEFKNAPKPEKGKGQRPPRNN